MLCGSVKLRMMEVITLAKAERIAIKRKNAFYTEIQKFFTQKNTAAR